MVTKEEINQAWNGLEHVRHRDSYWRVSRKTQDKILDQTIAILKGLELEKEDEK